MKKIFLLSFFFLGLATTQQIHAQNDQSSNEGPNFSKLDVSPMDVAIFRDADQKPLARVLYSRPQTRDREIFGKLVPYGRIWRTGANEANELTLYQDMTVGGKTIKKGTYTLFTVPQENEWTVVLNNDTNVWGAYDYKVEKDEARITVPVRKSPVDIEALSMAFQPMEGGAKLLIGWDDSYVEVPFKATK